jgi:hypothetical protein
VIGSLPNTVEGELKKGEAAKNHQRGVEEGRSPSFSLKGGGWEKID